MIFVLLVPLSLLLLLSLGSLARAMLAQRAMPRPELLLLGAVVNFFDALGIGSFAPTMAWLKFRKLVPDRVIPTTMFVGLTPPSIVEAVIFLALLGVLVDPWLLGGCMLALVAGSMAGVPLATRARTWVVQLIVAAALAVAAIFYAMANLGLMPVGGTATSLPLPLMLVAIAANFGFGILLNFGVGHFAPTLVLLSLMGMDPHLIFPIMAGGAGFAGGIVSIRHIRIGQINTAVAAGLALGGIPAVLVAAFIVKNMPIETLRWLVSVVVVYSALVMLRAGMAGRRLPQPADAAVD